MKRIGEFINVTDYVANGSFAALKENVQYSERPDFAVLVRLVDHNAGWSGPFVYINQHGFEFLSKSSLLPGDVVISNVGANAGTVFRVPDLGKPMTLGPNAVVLKDTNVPRYWYFFFSGPQGQTILRSILSGSAQPKFNKTDLRASIVPYPEECYQDAIASILGALDDKIDCNRRMNETLEAMARAMFKDWFVDFGPTKAKMEGRAPHLAPEIWDLFPDRLDDDGKPEGWETQSIYDLATVVYGAPFSSKLFNSESKGKPLIRIRDLATHAPAIHTEEQHPKGHLIFPGDIVVGMDGEFRMHIWKGKPAWLNQRVCHFEPKETVPRAFVAEALKRPLSFQENGKVGTTVIHLGKKDIDTFSIIYPGSGILNRFGTLVEPLVEKTVCNALESRSLAQTRDLLLPKLMSGEIRVRDAERAVEDVL